MLKSRYEEYSNIFNDLPCVFTKNIKRSKFNYSKNTNWHENLEIEFCNDGQGYVLLDGKNFNFSKGNIAIINSNVIHYTSTDTYVLFTCLFNKSILWRLSGGLQYISVFIKSGIN